MHVHISHELDLSDLNVIYVQQQNRIHLHHKQLTRNTYKFRNTVDPVRVFLPITLSLL